MHRVVFIELVLHLLNTPVFSDLPVPPPPAAFVLKIIYTSCMHSLFDFASSAAVIGIVP